MPDPEFTREAPVALTIAGSDCSAGAGLQADLKTFLALDVYGLTAVTCAVSEIPGAVNKIEPLSPSLVHDQIVLLGRAFPVRAIKTGMLFSADHVKTVARALSEIDFTGPLVVDPVMVASSGDPLIEDDAVEACKSLLFPQAALITPNLNEAAALLDRPVKTVDDLQPAALELLDRFGSPVLLKGGHLDGPHAADLLCLPDGTCQTFSAPIVRNVATHGTGCTLSAAIAAHLARGLALPDAVRESKTFITRAIAHAFCWNSPSGEIHALNHS